MSNAESHYFSPLNFSGHSSDLSRRFALSKFPVGMASAISTSYVLLVLFLSWFFLNETMSWMKIAGTRYRPILQRAVCAFVLLVERVCIIVGPAIPQG